ncbi:hypothetical protein LJC42_01760 [Eubacteriales bacterium OttesenSCG-928-K08]|nr:hypothetical protein [Eubacteriales bacterium OttesenSCG-928-K08]
MQHKFDPEFAIETAVRLAEKNIKSTDSWVSAEDVTEFIDGVYSFLVNGGDSSDE